MNHRIPILCVGSLSGAVLAALTALATPQARLDPLRVIETNRANSSPGSPHEVAPAKRNRTFLPSAPVKQMRFDRFIVKSRNGAAAAHNTNALLDVVTVAATRAGVSGIALQDDGRYAALSARYMRKLGVGADLVRLSRSLNQTETEALLDQLRSDAMIEYAQPDYLKEALSFTPNDLHYGLQWHYNHPTASIQAPNAWDISTGAGAVVAVLDTGYLDHADLSANIVPGYDFINDGEVAGDGDGRDPDAHDPGDWYGSRPSSFHGTHVAGTIAAVTNNGVHVAGVAFDAKVQPVRVLGHGGGYTSDIADAIVWSSGGSVSGVPTNPTPAEVINLSLGGFSRCSEDPVTQGAIDSANSRGTIVVVAAGNSNYDASYFSPAGCRDVLTVGASGSDGARSYFSNYGPAVAVSAPGGNAVSATDPADRWIWSLGNIGDREPVPSPEGDATVGSVGTSMASPHVAAVVAMMQSAAVAAGRAPLNLVQVRSVLRATATPWTVVPPANRPQGPGIINAAAAVLAATQDIPPNEGILLSNRIPWTTSGSPGEATLFKIIVPSGRTSLNLRTYGGSGDVSIYVARDRKPTTLDWDVKSAKPGNSEAVFVTTPAAGTYYMLVVGETAFGGVSVLGVY